MAKVAKVNSAQSKSMKKARLVKNRHVKNAAKAKKVTATRGSSGSSGKSQEPWFSVFAGSNNEEYQAYMRNEWGWEKRGDVALFEKLCLEGQQAGLSWATVLAKRAAYRKAFHNFNIAKCAAMSDKDVDRMLTSHKSRFGGRDSVICHRGKLLSIPQNARRVLSLRSAPYIDPKTGAACRTLDELLWSFVDGKPILNNWPSKKAIPTVTPTAETMAKALRKLGFSFVGATICYSLMQSCGLVIDHPKGTPEHRAAAARLARRRQSSR
mmetsp:Transcript_29956/g.75491  ORF Transcript_29956/g.75491 Transcript_29956/m.75491 type:complete len:267 (+) Transcript_29956:91-891(+)|eukprot:CAMPEP_0115673362 /NCGR_PEP_ID=MMETSP0272-20121206/53056_1 /TAXON_ID=71861 /ORGANISM="Scrippsiella trochoidea, Strain CCMP3099" /LENGTH=266 /DNA_ID=CAMNT_0003112217 /DNA_START=22 /DNA_END=822 /DNA_ORIENTATION=+